MAGAAHMASRSTPYPPPSAMNSFPIEPSLEQRERARAFERQQAMKRRVGQEMERERALLLERERVERMIERDRMAPRLGGPNRALDRERMAGGGERPIVFDRRMDGPGGVRRLDGSNGSSRLENYVGLDNRVENQVGALGADRRLENGVDRGLDMHMAVERRLEGGLERRLENPVGLERRVETGLERRIDTGLDRRIDTAVEGDDDRSGLRHPLRPGSFERTRSADRDRDEERDKIRDRGREDEKLIGTAEKHKERGDDSAGGIQELVAQYKTALAELTFNSKPIITNLTIIAGENLNSSKAIAATVCAHILEVPIEQKLPSLYLLDSIVKNIGSSYVKHFAARLAEVFIKSYRQMDPSTYPAMQHLFKTWRGVFPSKPLRAIETELEFNFTANATPSSNTARLDESPPQRSGHSIHVNPKYLEAQRQKMQQTSQANALPSRIQKGDAVSGEPNYTRKPPSSYTDYDYGSAEPGDEGGRSRGGEEKKWDSGWPREGEEVLRPSESNLSVRYGSKNVYELPQASPRALVDAYGNIRGIRAPRLHAVPVQPGQDLDGRNRGLSRNWQNAEEEEYIWDEISPRLQDVTRHVDGLEKDWYSADADKNILPGSLGGGKPFGLDQPLSDHPGWRRPGSQSAMDRPPSIERVIRETDEQAPIPSFQQDIGHRLFPDPVLEASALGPTGRLMMVNRPISGRLSHPLPQHLNPPSQSGLRAVPVTSRNIPSGSSNQVSQVTNLPGINLGSGASTVVGPALAARSPLRPNMGSSFGSGILNFGSLSPVTPASGLNFQHRQQLQRPPSPPPLTVLAQRQLPLPPVNSSIQHQPNLPSLRQHVFSSKQAQLQDQAQSMQPHSLQPLPLPLNPLQQPQVVQQLPQQHSRIPQSSQQLQPLHIQSHQMPLSQPKVEQVSAQQPSQTVPILPQLSSGLLQSLQQLQHHLPPVSSAPSQASQPPRPPFQLHNPLQQNLLTQSPQQPHHPQHSLSHTQTLQPPQPPQTLSHASPPRGSVMNDNLSTQLSGSPSDGSASNLLAAFLQSGLMPPSQASQIPSHPRPSSPQGGLLVHPEPTMGLSTQVHPPLPSGPPPPQYPANSLPGQNVSPAPPVSTLASSLHALSPLPPPAVVPLAAYSSMRIVQPPLPPGPPPMSSQVAGSSSQLPFSAGPPPSSGNDLTSLLSSLMAQGVISASSSAPPNLTQPAGVAHNLSLPMSFTKSSITLHPGGALPVPPGAAAPFATVVSTTLVTASRAPESSTAATVSLTEATMTGDPSLTDFRQEFLRERQEFIIDALYSDFPRQCKTCGLRFKYQEEHSKHMDWHVARNRRQKSSRKVSRKWFVSVKEWLNGTGAAASEVTPNFFAEAVEEKPEEHETVAVPADENQSACALCGEPFEDFYSDDTEEWMYRGAVYMNAPGGVMEGLDSSQLGPIVHAKCRSESAGSVAVDSTEDTELDEDDGLGHRGKRVRY